MKIYYRGRVAGSLKRSASKRSKVRRVRNPAKALGRRFAIGDRVRLVLDDYESKDTGTVIKHLPGRKIRVDYPSRGYQIDGKVSEFIRVSGKKRKTRRASNPVQKYSRLWRVFFVLESYDHGSITVSYKTSLSKAQADKIAKKYRGGTHKGRRILKVIVQPMDTVGALRRASNPAKRRKKAPVVKFGDTSIDTWFERDRASVVLTNDKTGETIFESWDDDVHDLVEMGFLNPRDWHTSAYDYAVDLGIITGY